MTVQKIEHHIVYRIAVAHKKFVQFPRHILGVMFAGCKIIKARLAESVIHNAVVLEEVAFMNWHAMMLNPSRDKMDSVLLNKHYFRKHGNNAYYGQNIIG